jgi:hypothetical protein
MGVVFLQKDISSLFYLCFSPCNLAKTSTNISKIMSSSVKLYIWVHVQDLDGDTFKANGQRLKLFLEPNPQNSEEVNVLNFV